LEEAHKQLVAVSEKQKEQLQKLETENANLLSQITELNIKVRRLWSAVQIAADWVC
jgi:E3 ubiquitin-protein ligase BRE1